jgi:uncharacterized tellurite resistance protein B-like protein
MRAASPGPRAIGAVLLREAQQGIHADDRENDHRLGRLAEQQRDARRRYEEEDQRGRQLPPGDAKRGPAVGRRQGIRTRTSPRRVLTAEAAGQGRRVASRHDGTIAHVRPPRVMFDDLRHLVQDSLPGTPGAHSHRYAHDVRLAACALLVELALADGFFSVLERARIVAMLRRWFGVHAADAEQLLAQAASARRDAGSVDSFARRIVEEYEPAQRALVAELLYEVAIADGVVDAAEERVLTELAAALELDPVVLARARHGDSRPETIRSRSNSID